MLMAFSSLNGISGTATQSLALPALGTSSRSSDRSDAAATPFGDLFAGTASAVDSLESQARAAVEGLMTGSGVDVHQAMIATQKADMAFEFALAVRNKAVQAYQSVMQMQF